MTSDRIAVALVRQPDQGTAERAVRPQIRAVVRPLVRQPDQSAEERAASGLLRPLVRPLVRQPDQKASWATR